jgi:predicted DNA binding CopG/RHH family protein
MSRTRCVTTGGLHDDLDQIRSAAAKRGTSLQNYLRDAVHAQAA